MFKFPVFRVYLRTVLYVLIFSFTVLFLMKVFGVKSDDNPYLPKIESQLYPNITFPKIKSLAELKVKWIERKIERLSGGMPKTDNRVQIDMEPVREVNRKVHAFYYTWFRNEEEDGKWSHWFLGSTFPKYSTEMKTAYYPELGMYSSRNKTIIDTHMSQMQKAGIGVAIASWMPSTEDNILMQTLLDAADKHTIKIALHVTHFRFKGIDHFINKFYGFMENFGQHNALHRMKKNERFLPVIYIFEPYNVDSMIWREFLSPIGNATIRNSQNDAIFIALLSQIQHRMEIKKANFDGFYTYYATNGYSYGSSWRNWRMLGKFAKENKLLFVPCVAPGYNEGSLSAFHRPRLNGNYYEVAWKCALDSDPSIIAINSFNAWEEGSQIEPAIPKAMPLFQFSDYEKVDSRYYLDFTGFWVKYLTENKSL